MAKDVRKPQAAAARAAPVHDTQMVHRLEFFSDAVFAIVLTLLVLELRPPEIHGAGGLLQALVEMRGHFIAFALSFGVTSIFWAAHMTILRRLTAFDWPVAWANLVFLFTITLMPFSQALIGEHGVFGEAWALYCALLVLVSITQTVLLLTIVRGGGRLVGGPVERRDLAFRLVRALSPGVGFAVGLALNLTGFPDLAALCWILIVPILIMGRIFLGPRKAAGQ